MSGVRPSVAAAASPPCAQRASDGRPAATARTERGGSASTIAPLGSDTAAATARIRVDTAPRTGELSGDTEHRCTGPSGCTERGCAAVRVLRRCTGTAQGSPHDVAGNGRARLVARCRSGGGCPRDSALRHLADAARHHGVARRGKRSSRDPRRAAGAARGWTPRCAAREANERIHGWSVGCGPRSEEIAGSRARSREWRRAAASPG